MTWLERIAVLLSLSVFVLLGFLLGSCASTPPPEPVPECTAAVRDIVGADIRAGYQPVNQLSWVRLYEIDLLSRDRTTLTSYILGESALYGAVMRKVNGKVVGRCHTVVQGDAKKTTMTIWKIERPVPAPAGHET